MIVNLNGISFVLGFLAGVLWCYRHKWCKAVKPPEPPKT